MLVAGGYGGSRRHTVCMWSAGGRRATRACGGLVFSFFLPCDFDFDCGLRAPPDRASLTSHFCAALHQRNPTRTQASSVNGHGMQRRRLRSDPEAKLTARGREYEEDRKHSHRHVRAREPATIAVRADRAPVALELAACRMEMHASRDPRKA